VNEPLPDERYFSKATGYCYPKAAKTGITSQSRNTLQAATRRWRFFVKYAQGEILNKLQATGGVFFCLLITVNYAKGEILSQAASHC
jgi:hypothetical protein